MTHNELLYVFAQVAVALAGFASLIAFLGNLSSGPRHQIQRNRLLGMVRVALMATVFSLLPVVIFAQGVTEETAWRVSAVFFSLAHAAITVVAWRRTLWARREKLPTPVPFIAPTATLALLAIVLAAALPTWSAGLYLGGLFLVLVVSGALFFSLIVTFLDRGE